MSAAPAQNEEPVVTCDKCQEEFPTSKCCWINQSLCKKAEEQGKARKAIHRCSDCSSACGRLMLLKQEFPETHSLFQDLEPQDKATFFAGAKDKLGAAFKRYV